MDEDKTPIIDEHLHEVTPRAKNRGGRPRKDPSLASPNLLRRAGRPATARVRREVEREDEREAERDDAPRGQRLRRKSRRDTSQFDIDVRRIPSGASYEWKREKTFGQSDDYYMVNLRDNHWTPVPASRHPELVPDGRDDGPIRRDGMILMQRPAYLTNEARVEDYELAVEQVRGKETEVRSDRNGEFPREHPSTRKLEGIRRTYGPPMIPEK